MGILTTWFNSRRKKIDRPVVKRDVRKASVTVSLKDGRKFTITRVGWWFHSAGHTFQRTGDDILHKYLDDRKGLLKVDGGHRVATCDVAEISPVQSEECLKPASA